MVGDATVAGSAAGEETAAGDKQRRCSACGSAVASLPVHRFFDQEIGWPGGANLFLDILDLSDCSGESPSGWQFMQRGCRKTL